MMKIGHILFGIALAIMAACGTRDDAVHHVGGYELYFFDASGYQWLHGHAWRDVGYWHELDDSEIARIAPFLDAAGFAAVASFGPDGIFKDIRLTREQSHRDGHLEIWKGRGRLYLPIQYFPHQAQTPTSRVGDIEVTIFFTAGNMWMRDWIQASFAVGGYHYHIVHQGTDKGAVAAIIEGIIFGDGMSLAVLDDVVPQPVIWQELTLSEARQDPIFGGLLPNLVPDDFPFIEATRSHDEYQNGLYLVWGHQDVWGSRQNFIRWRISCTHNLYHHVTNVFMRDEITAARIPPPDTHSGAIHFYVWYGDVVIEVWTRGISAQVLIDMLPY